MTILQALKQLRDDLKLWVTNNLKALNDKIDEKTVPIDSELNIESTNLVQNRAIAEELNKLSTKIDENLGFSGEYSDIQNAPDILDDASGNLTIIDKVGNVIFDVDKEGIHTTKVSINGKDAATKAYVDEAISAIDFSGVDIDLTDYYNKTETDKVIDAKTTSVAEQLNNSLKSNSDEFIIVDSVGNIIGTISAQGMQTTLVRCTDAIIGNINVVSELNNLDNVTTSLTSRVTAVENTYYEEWTFILEDGSSIIKKVMLRQ